MKDDDFLCWALHHLQRVELMKGEMCHRELLDLIIIFPLKSSSPLLPQNKKNSTPSPTQVCFYQAPWCQRLLQDQPCVVPFAGLGAQLSVRAALAWLNSRWASSSYDRILAPSARHSESLTQFKIQLFKSQLKGTLFLARLPRIH